MPLSGANVKSDEATDERTSFVRTAKLQRKYGSTGTNMNNSQSSHNPTSYVHHHVQPGDTLQGIALKYGTTMEQLKRVNKMWTNDALFLRDYLLVPSPNIPEQAEDRDTCVVATLVIENEHNPNITALPANYSEISSVIPESLNTSAVSSSCSQHSRKGSSDINIMNEASHQSLQEYLGSIDVQIEEAKNAAQRLQETSEVLKNLPDIGVQSSWSRSQASSRLRLSLTDLGAEFNAATTVTIEPLPSTVVLQGGNKRIRSSLNRLEKTHDEIFEL